MHLCIRRLHIWSEWLQLHALSHALHFEMHCERSHASCFTMNAIRRETWEVRNETMPYLCWCVHFKTVKTDGRKKREKYLGKDLSCHRSGSRTCDAIMCMRYAREEDGGRAAFARERQRADSRRWQSTSHRTFTLRINMEKADRCKGLWTFHCSY